MRRLGVRYIVLRQIHAQCQEKRGSLSLLASKADASATLAIPLALPRLPTAPWMGLLLVVGTQALVNVIPVVQVALSHLVPTVALIMAKAIRAAQIRTNKAYLAQVQADRRVLALNASALALQPAALALINYLKSFIRAEPCTILKNNSSYFYLLFLLAYLLQAVRMRRLGAQFSHQFKTLVVPTAQ